MRKAIIILALAVSGYAGVRLNRTITVAAGTPVRLSTTKVLVTRILIQMQTGGSGRGYVMAGIPVGTTPVATTSADLTAEIGPASATGPGGTYADADPSGIDISRIWLDGANTGDKITVTYEVKN